MKRYVLELLQSDLKYDSLVKKKKAKWFFMDGVKQIYFFSIFIHSGDYVYSLSLADSRFVTVYLTSCDIPTKRGGCVQLHYKELDDITLHHAKLFAGEISNCLVRSKIPTISIFVISDLISSYCL